MMVKFICMVINGALREVQAFWEVRLKLCLDTSSALFQVFYVLILKLQSMMKNINLIIPCIIKVEEQFIDIDDSLFSVPQRKWHLTVHLLKCLISVV